MRTTLTLEPDVARLIEEEAHRQRKPIKVVVNEALRRGLAATGRAPEKRAFRIKPHVTTLRAGVDAGSFNKLVDELEDDAIADKIGEGR